MSISKTKLLSLLADNAYQSYRNLFSGNMSINQQEIYDRMSNPEIGDLVLETSSFTRTHPLNRIGKLISITNEPYDEQDPDGDHISRRDIWTIERLNGEQFRWENCNFIVIAEDSFDFPRRLDENGDIVYKYFEEVD